jgi:hypothetical protein
MNNLATTQLFLQHFRTHCWNYFLTKIKMSPFITQEKSSNLGSEDQHGSLMVVNF